MYVLKNNNLRCHRRWQCIFCGLGHFFVSIKKLLRTKYKNRRYHREMFNKQPYADSY